MTADTPRLSLLGTTALLFDAPGTAMTLATQQRIWALAREAQAWPEVLEAVLGMNNLMLVFSAPPRDLSGTRARLLDAWETLPPMTRGARVLDLPVVYGGEGGAHLDDVMAHTGLTLDEIVELHTAPVYLVYALGSHPGFCYLGGMDPRLATPRRKVPSLSVPTGSVGIGGFQTGVSASVGPSGWNNIGSTSVDFFDPRKPTPVLLEPGDGIRFVASKVLR